MFSSRLRHGAGRNRLALAIEQRRASGLPIIDLTLSNPTRAGFRYPPDLLKPLGHVRGLQYDPKPFGLAEARQAVSDDFARRGATVPPEHVVVTASTSEGYSVLFKLLCDPGDTVLAPQPSYPIIEHLADLDAVALEPYALDFHGSWSIDVDGLREKIAKVDTGGHRVRAVIVISPNNPTGSIIKAEEARVLASLAREIGLAVIVDEVFADYLFAPASPPALQEDALTFRLGGLSKTIGMPQLKLGWIGVSGPAPLVHSAMDRLETICDTYLSVSTPLQAAAPQLLADGAAVRAQIQERVAGNLAWLRTVLTEHRACSLLSPDGGWYAVVQVPAIQSEEQLVLDLLHRTGILVHPGYFFDFAREAFIVLSLLPEPAVFRPAAERVLAEMGRA